MTMYKKCLRIEKNLQLINNEIQSINCLDSDAFKKLSSLEKRMKKNILKIFELEDKLDK